MAVNAHLSISLQGISVKILFMQWIVFFREKCKKQTVYTKNASSTQFIRGKNIHFQYLRFNSDE